MAEKETRVIESADLRAESGDKPKIAGYAAVFDSESNDLGGFIEIIRKGAFDETLASNPDVSARVQHQGGLMTVGRTTNGTLKLSVDKKGLRYEAMPPNTQAGRDIVELIRDKFITKSSFAFTLRGDGGDRWNFEANPPRRELLNLNLHDVAPVDGPAYNDTSVAVRSMEAAKRDVNVTITDSPSEPNTDGLDCCTECAADCQECIDECQAIIDGGSASPEVLAMCQDCIKCCTDCIAACTKMAAADMSARKQPEKNTPSLRERLVSEFDYLKTIKPAM